MHKKNDLVVPDSLNRNHPNVRAMGDPADTGVMLINYMCARIGIDSLSGLDVLDLGCGVRFSQSIINRNVPIGTYTGVEVAKKIIDFLDKNVTDPRMSFHHVNTVNRMYNPEGEKLNPDCPSPLGDAMFDVACMFSVITHQQPEEIIPVFRFVRQHVKSGGHLFFSAFIHDGEMDYHDRDSKRPGLFSSYSMRRMMEYIEDTNWTVISIEEPNPNGVPIQTSFLCKPA